jgi:hypothetical protein
VETAFFHLSIFRSFRPHSFLNEEATKAMDLTARYSPLLLFKVFTSGYAAWEKPEKKRTRITTAATRSVKVIGFDNLPVYTPDTVKHRFTVAVYLDFDVQQIGNQ